MPGRATWRPSREALRNEGWRARCRTLEVLKPKGGGGTEDTECTEQAERKFRVFRVFRDSRAFDFPD